MARHKGRIAPARVPTAEPSATTAAPSTDIFRGKTVTHAELQDTINGWAAEGFARDVSWDAIGTAEEGAEWKGGDVPRLYVYAWKNAE